VTTSSVVKGRLAIPTKGMGQRSKGSPDILVSEAVQNGGEYGSSRRKDKQANYAKR